MRIGVRSTGAQRPQCQLISNLNPPFSFARRRFAGDLLLREDQMLMGAWNMKVKKVRMSENRNERRAGTLYDLL